MREFPRDHRGDVVYCNVEGVSWLGEDRLAMVSDRTNPDEQDACCRAKEEFVHVFSLD